jgi:hypothetical protein
MVRAHNRRIAAIVATHNSSRSRWKSNQRLGNQLQHAPSEDYPVLGADARCSHGFGADSEHNCRDYENAKRAARGAPPIEGKQ